MLTIVLQLTQSIIKGDHPSLHLAHGCLGQILELIDLLSLGILSLDHQLHLPVQSLLVLPRLLTPSQDLSVQTTLEVVQLFDFLLVHLNHCLHTLDAPISVELPLLRGSHHSVNAFILEFYIGGFARPLPLKQEIVVFDLLLESSEGAFDLVEFDGLLSLLLVEGLQQIHHDLPHLGLDLVPLEFLYLYGLLPRHQFYLCHRREKQGKGRVKVTAKCPGVVGGR